MWKTQEAECLEKGVGCVYFGKAWRHKYKPRQWKQKIGCAFPDECYRFKRSVDCNENGEYCKWQQGRCVASDAPIDPDYAPECWKEGKNGKRYCDDLGEEYCTYWRPKRAPGSKRTYFYNCRVNDYCNFHKGTRKERQYQCSQNSDYCEWSANACVKK